METVNGYTIYYKPHEVWNAVTRNHDGVLAVNEYGTQVASWFNERSGKLELYYSFDFMYDPVFVGYAKNNEECEMLVATMYEALFGYKQEENNERV